jgi:hypothetical protein
MVRGEVNDVVEILGEPESYFWYDREYTKDNLPEHYLMNYPEDLVIVMANNLIEEIRFHQAGFKIHGLEVGLHLDETLAILGIPDSVVEGKKNSWDEGILFKDIEGQKGLCYYHSAIGEIKCRIFFTDYLISGLYFTRAVESLGSGYIKSVIEKGARIEPYSDMRWNDLRQVDPSILSEDLMVTLRFNENTIWPKEVRDMAQRIMTEAMNPGLGIRKLHEEGITGKGVHVAIIDQNLLLDHPEFAGKIIKYHDTGCNMADDEGSMHAPAVTSLLVGTRMGVAPDAKVYFAAAPSWTKDAMYQAEALSWIIEENAYLPKGEKIRVVSVSSAPSGPGSPFTKDSEMWDQTRERAEKNGILILDCTKHRGIIGPA